MEKGEKADIFISGLDIGIFNAVKNEPEGIGIMELREELDISHNSLKPHVDKWKEKKLLIEEKVPKSRKLLLKINEKHKKEIDFLIKTFK